MDSTQKPFDQKKRGGGEKKKTKNGKAEDPHPKKVVGEADAHQKKGREKEERGWEGHRLTEDMTQRQNKRYGII